jgi:hypothetical protein
MSTQLAIAKLNSMIAEANETITTFKAALDKDPCYALTNSNCVFHRAAEIRVASTYINYMKQTPAFTIQQCIDTLYSSMRFQCQHPSQSTSPTADLMHSYESMALVEVLNILENCAPSQ